MAQLRSFWSKARLASMGKGPLSGAIVWGLIGAAFWAGMACLEILFGDVEPLDRAYNLRLATAFGAVGGAVLGGIVGITYKIVGGGYLRCVMAIAAGVVAGVVVSNSLYPFHPGVRLLYLGAAGAVSASGLTILAHFVHLRKRK